MAGKKILLIDDEVDFIDVLRTPRLFLTEK